MSEATLLHYWNLKRSPRAPFGFSLARIVWPLITVSPGTYSLTCRTSCIIQSVYRHRYLNRAPVRCI
jgi:hypothetical protein